MLIIGDGKKQIIKLHLLNLTAKDSVLCAIVQSLYYLFICTYFPAREQHEIDVASRFNRIEMTFSTI